MEFPGLRKNSLIQIEIFNPILSAEMLSESNIISNEKKLWNKNYQDMIINLEKDDVLELSKIFYDCLENEEKINNIEKNKNKKEKKKVNEMNIIYEIKNNEKEIKIFGEDFVEKNKTNCYLINDGKQQELCSKINVMNKKNLEIKLKETKLITDMKNIFEKCSNLISIPDISKWDFSNIVDISGMFNGCSNLKSLPDISKWNTSKITNISGLFNHCILLSSLPEISKWDTSNIIDMNSLFSECNLLSYLPDISNWNMSKVTDISNMFEKCFSLKCLPDISIHQI